MQPLFTKRLILRELTTEDAGEMFLLNEDPEVIKYTGDSPFSNVDETKIFLAGYEQYRKYNRGRLAMILRGTNEFLGWCGLKFLEETQETDLGFRLHKKFWNQGYATEAAMACLDYGFNTLELSEIIAHAMKANIASIKVLEKLGFQFKKDFMFHGMPGVFMELKKEDFQQTSAIKFD